VILLNHVQAYQHSYCAFSTRLMQALLSDFLSSSAWIEIRVANNQ